MSKFTRKAPISLSKLEKTTVVTDQTHLDVFHFKVNIYYGDGDFYENLDFLVKDPKEALNFLDFLINHVGEAHPNGRGCDDHYREEVKDWDIWFGSGIEYVNGKWVHNRKAGVFAEEWPSNDELGGEATFNSVEVHYYDESGIKYDVRA